ncbi:MULTISPECIES: hypothetical protein [unclassified Streptomyces]|uniref:hypothetical protein n=1 Tax=unclassified Streptomyces TaxID=2593676 RepID=UPI00381BFEA4
MQRACRSGRAWPAIHTGEGRDTRTDLYQNRSRHIWDSRSHAATLRNLHDRIVDKASWGNRHHGGHHRHPVPPGARLTDA